MRTVTDTSRRQVQQEERPSKCRQGGKSGFAAQKKTVYISTAVDLKNGFQLTWGSLRVLDRLAWEGRMDKKRYRERLTEQKKLKKRNQVEQISANENREPLRGGNMDRASQKDTIRKRGVGSWRGDTETRETLSQMDRLLVSR